MMFSIFGVIIFCTCILLEVSTQNDNLIVQLREGLIQGHTLKTWNGNDYYAFQEIPFAAPPVGALRYKEPTAPPVWGGILNTTQNTKQCLQEFNMNPSLTETEDCLYINVYSPQRPGSSNLLPVFVWVHGGAFYLGTGALQSLNPGGFMDHDVTVVTFNYRLGPLGFLTTGDGVIPGNLGLKDQVLAFQWVKSNIHLFGGNPDEITIGGESAGAYSVGFQLVSNSQDLYRAAIQQSGSSLNHMGITANARENAFRLGRAMDPQFYSESSADLLELLQHASMDDIRYANAKVVPYDPNTAGYITRLKYVPVLENPAVNNPLISRPMAESFDSGNFHRVPALLGFNSEEALGFYNGALDFIAGEYDQYPQLLADAALNIAPENAYVVGSEIIRIYSGTTFSNDKAAFVKYSSDAGFTRGMMRQGELSAKHVPIYFYEYSYLGDMVPNNRYVVPGAVGAVHAEEMSYMWNGPPGSQADRLTSERLLTLWTNFIKYLNPTPVSDQLLNNVIWPRLTNEPSNFQYLDIDNTLSIKSNPRFYQQLRPLLERYQQPPFLVF